MPGLVPGIPVLLTFIKKDVDSGISLADIDQSAVVGYVDVPTFDLLLPSLECRQKLLIRVYCPTEIKAFRPQTI
jgi:hypothetical protein